MAGIIMIGTSPMFYRIPITTELITHLQIGERPPTETVVLSHVPTIPRLDRRLSEGMKPLDNRKAILQCYEAFKKFLD